MELLGEYYTSVEKSLSEIDEQWREYDCLIICGTHAPHDTEMMIEKIAYARESGRPFYGECFGHQLACIEWARNGLDISDATSEEFGTGTLVVVKRPKMKVGFQDGESWWSNYYVLENIEKDFIAHRPKHFFTAPFHPSYQSSKNKPHPILVKFLEYASKHRNHDI